MSEQYDSMSDFEQPPMLPSSSYSMTAVKSDNIERNLESIDLSTSKRLDYRKVAVDEKVKEPGKRAFLDYFDIVNKCEFNPT